MAQRRQPRAQRPTISGVTRTPATAKTRETSDAMSSSSATPRPPVASKPLLIGAGAALLGIALLLLAFAGRNTPAGDAADPDAEAVAAPQPTVLPVDLDGWTDADIDLSTVAIDATGVPVVELTAPADTPRALDGRFADGTTITTVGATTATIDNGRFTGQWAPPEDPVADPGTEPAATAATYATSVAAAVGGIELEAVAGTPAPWTEAVVDTVTEHGWQVPISYRIPLSDGPDTLIRGHDGIVIVAFDGTVVGWDLPAQGFAETGTTFTAADRDHVIEAVGNGDLGPLSTPPRPEPFTPGVARLELVADNDQLTWWWVLADTDHPNARRVYIDAGATQ